MELKGSNFLLREWCVEDIPSISASADNINVWNNMRDGFPRPYTEADGQAYFESLKAKPYQQDFAVVADGKAIGNIGFMPGVDVERFSAEIAYFIGEPYWGRGIMSAAVRLLTEEYIFRHTDIVRVFTAVFDYNTGSQRVLEKAGFRKAGIFHKAVFKNGNFIDEIAYERVRTIDN